jgi:hypothetical protein
VGDIRWVSANGRPVHEMAYFMLESLGSDQLHPRFNIVEEGAEANWEGSESDRTGCGERPGRGSELMGRRNEQTRRDSRRLGRGR